MKGEIRIDGYKQKNPEYVFLNMFWYIYHLLLFVIICNGLPLLICKIMCPHRLTSFATLIQDSCNTYKAQVYTNNIHITFFQI